VRPLRVSAVHKAITSKVFVQILNDWTINGLKLVEKSDEKFANASALDAFTQSSPPPVPPPQISKTLSKAIICEFVLK
jgi:hypothetical protein